MDVAGVVRRVRDRAPLVHCLTAAVSMNLVADALLAAGARPMMTETLQEAPTIVRRADAMVANLGTLSTDGMVGIPATARVAAELGLPWVLDPAAVGPTRTRIDLAQELLQLAPGVVRANASEVLVLAGLGRGGRGPDAADEPEAALDAARQVALEHGCVVAVSGAVDLVTDGTRVLRVHAGSEMLTRVTGTGCSLAALTAACAAVADPLEAAVAASLWLGLAGERAAVGVRGPGSFRARFVDELFALEADEVPAGVVVEGVA